MAVILQVETSTEVCSVSLSENGLLINCFESSESNSHTERLTLLIKQSLAEAGLKMSQLDAVAIGDGPGSYTSLRVGVATAKGICYATGCPIIALDSLTTLSYGIPDELLNENDCIIPMIDAKRMEVYCSVFDINRNKKKPTEAIILQENSFLAFSGNKNQIHLCGNGSEKWFKNFATEQFKLHHKKTSSSYMTIPAHMAYEKKLFADLNFYIPNYFKAPNITKSSKKLL